MISKDYISHYPTENLLNINNGVFLLVSNFTLRSMRKTIGVFDLFSRYNSKTAVLINKVKPWP